MLRMVPQNEWVFSDFGDARRRHRLSNPPSGECLLTRLIAKANDAAQRQEIDIKWELACCLNGYFRLNAQVPVDECTFDFIYNGRSGYRAQYYLSPEEGINYNSQILYGLIPAIRASYDRKPLPIDFALIERSLRSSHAKVWIFDDCKAVNAAKPDTLNPPRWAEFSSVGRRVPLPDIRKIDVKGVFIDPCTGAFMIPAGKRDRHLDLHNKGWA